MARDSLAAGVVAALVLLAGCTGPDAEAPARGQDAGAPASSSQDPGAGKADAGTATGTIEGTVLSTAGEPLPNATVKLFHADGGEPITASLTDQATFAFDDVPVGTHRLEASLFGYETDVAPVTVLEASVAKVELVLAPLATAAGFNVSTEFRGRITCYFGAPEANANCRAVGTAVGKEQRDSFTVFMGANATPPMDEAVTGILVEATWQEPQVGSGGANPLWGMTMIVGDPLDSERNRQANGLRGWHDPPPRVLVDLEYIEPWGLAGGGDLPFSLRPTSPQPVSPGPRIGNALDIEFTALATVFYGLPPDPCWSPMKATTFPCP